jgi:hypothetical protein
MRVIQLLALQAMPVLLQFAEGSAVPAGSPDEI